jgi:hypothetical protein
MIVPPRDTPSLATKLTLIVFEVMPMLASLGMPESVVTHMLEDNVRRWFDRQDRY